jgi:hypothetical protein
VGQLFTCIDVWLGGLLDVSFAPAQHDYNVIPEMLHRYESAHRLLSGVGITESSTKLSHTPLDD